MKAHIICTPSIEAYRNLGAAIVIQMLKDYFAEPFEVSKKQKEYYDQEVIKKQLASEYICSLTDGLSLTVLRELNNNEDFVRQNIVMLRNEDKRRNS